MYSRRSVRSTLRLTMSLKTGVLTGTQGEEQTLNLSSSVVPAIAEFFERYGWLLVFGTYIYVVTPFSFDGGGYSTMTHGQVDLLDSLFDITTLSIAHILPPNGIYYAMQARF